MHIPDQIEREVVIDAPVERVWTLITQAEHLGTWFADDGATVDLRPGGELEMRWKEHGTVRARVERVEPERLFAYRWALLNDTGDAEPTEGNSTLVEFTLAPDAGATRLRVVESGFSGLDCSDERRLKNVEDNTEGWRLELDELVEHAARVTA